MLAKHILISHYEAMSHENIPPTTQPQNFGELATAVSSFESLKQELSEDELRLDQQIREKIDEKDTVVRKIRSLDNKMGLATSSFVSEIPNLPVLENAVFTIRLRKIWERFSGLSVTRKLATLTEINQEAEDLTRFQATINELEEPSHVLALGFKKINLAEGGNGAGPIVKSSVIGLFLMLGEVEPETQFVVRETSYKVDGGLGRYSLPSSIMLPIKNELTVGSTAMSWGYPYGVDTWLDAPTVIRKDEGVAELADERSMPIKILERDYDIHSDSPAIQFILGREVISLALSSLANMQGLDKSPLSHATRYIDPLA